ncbi:MAG: FxsA family protein [Actinomycetota bacterium]|nr:FxsA family protein [Actinomycetota bacterium]
MFPVLLVLFLIVPIVELAVIIQVGQAIGVVPTIATLIGVSVVGSWLVKREGMGVWRRFRQQMEAGHVPGRELADGVMIMLAGALLLTPGFVTDVFGILLLLPPVRAAIRVSALRHLTERGYRVRRS